MLGLDHFGEPCRLLTPLEIDFTKKRVLRPFYFWLTVGVVTSVMFGLGLNHPPWPGYRPDRELYGFFCWVLGCVGYPLLCILRMKADLAEGKAATISGPVSHKKISWVNTLFVQVHSEDLLDPPFLKCVKAAYEQLSEQERVSVDYLPRTRVALRVCQENHDAPLWAADPSAKVRWLR